MDKTYGKTAKLKWRKYFGIISLMIKKFVTLQGLNV